MKHNSITLLTKAGDLTFRNGDLVVTRRGDLMPNDEDYSGFTRLVQVRRYDFPTLRTLFVAAFDTDGEEAAKQDLDAMRSRRWGRCGGRCTCHRWSQGPPLPCRDGRQRRG